MDPPAGAEFTLNVILHVFVMLLALTILYVAVVVPQETQLLTNELSDTFKNALQTGWGAFVTVDNARQLQPVLSPILPLLARLSKQYAVKDASQAAENKAVLGIAYVVLFILALLFVVTVLVILWCGASAKRTASMVFKVGIENLVVLLIVGAAELTFFLTVASKYVPVMPSAVTTAIFNLFNSKALAPAGAAVA